MKEEIAAVDAEIQDGFSGQFFLSGVSRDNLEISVDFENISGGPTESSILRLTFTEVGYVATWFTDYMNISIREVQRSDWQMLVGLTKNELSDMEDEGYRVFEFGDFNSQATNSVIFAKSVRVSTLG